MRILVIEDEHRIAEALKQGLEQESYAVDVCYDGEDGYNSALTSEYDAILLDVMLPSMNGFEVCATLRADHIHTPIMMLTARDQSRDIVAGLNTGADDYLAKPFSFAQATVDDRRVAQSRSVAARYDH
jgi:two-component system OmpR family response regulator